MNTPDPTLRPALLDELLSADLDGEFDRAAAELGLAPPEARTAVAATPGAAERRAALARARDQLAARPALAEADEQRLVAAALDRGAADLERARRRRAERRRHQAGGVLAAAGSAAAVIAVIFALAAGNHGGSAKSASVAAPSEAATATPPRAAAQAGAAKSRSVVFGEVSHASALRRQVAAALHAAPIALPNASVPTTFAVADGKTPAPPQGATGPAGPAGPGTTGSDISKRYAPAPLQGLQGDEGIQGAGLLAAAAPRGLIGADGVVVNGPLSSATAATAASPPPVVTPLTSRRCIAAGARAAGLRSSPAITGSGTYAGRPAVIAVFGRAQGYVAYVLSVPACSVITHIAVP